MRSKVFWPLAAAVVFAASVVACGDDKDEPPCAVETDEDGNELVDCNDTACADHPLCQPQEICHNGIDDTGNGLIDCQDPLCADDDFCEGWVCEDGACIKECESQRECDGDPRVMPSLRSICDAGTCELFASFDSTGKPKTAEATVHTNLTRVPRPATLRSLVISYLHPVRPDGSRLDCEVAEDLIRQELLDDGSQVNVASRTAMRVNELSNEATNVTAGVTHIPIPTKPTGYVVVARFYNGAPDIHNEPRGVLAAFACREDVGATASTVNLEAHPGCSPGEVGSCPENWTCSAVGICHYDQCEPKCGSHQTCRELDGEPVCLRLCGENVNLGACDIGERCDDSPPWRDAACVPED